MFDKGQVEAKASGSNHLTVGAPNQPSGDNSAHTPFDSPVWDKFRDQALKGGGFVLDSSPLNIANMPGYADWVSKAVNWGKANGLHTELLMSPAGAYTGEGADQRFKNDIDTSVGLLRKSGALQHVDRIDIASYDPNDTAAVIAAGANRVLQDTAS